MLSKGASLQLLSPSSNINIFSNTYCIILLFWHQNKRIKENQREIHFFCIFSFGFGHFLKMAFWAVCEYEVHAFCQWGVWVSAFAVFGDSLTLYLQRHCVDFPTMCRLLQNGCIVIWQYWGKNKSFRVSFSAVGFPILLVCLALFYLHRFFPVVSLNSPVCFLLWFRRWTFTRIWTAASTTSSFTSWTSPLLPPTWLSTSS